MKKKSLALVLALAMIVVCVVGGTLAWLTDKTAPVTNTFTYGDINIKLAETTGQSYKMIPGYTITKDPKVTVLAGSEKCYLFVKVEMENNTYGTGDTAVNYLSYDMADGWIALDGVDGVYYRIVDASTATADQEFGVLKNDQVTVNDTVTKTMLNALNAEGATQPTLTFTAYACQYMKNSTQWFTAAEAWAKVYP